MDNQFINAPLLVNRSAPDLAPKEELIKKLESKNNKLKAELIKIQRAIQDRFGTEEEEAPRKRQSIFQHQDNYEVLTKELANTYKRIKMYEYEIGKLQESNKPVNLPQKITQFQAVIREKKNMADKLKHQLIRQQRNFQDNTRRLSNNSQKEQLETYLRKLTQEAKYYKEKLKDIEDKESRKTNNLKKQYQTIKKVENQLLEVGVAGGELEELKRNAIQYAGSPRKTMRQSKVKQEHSGSEEEVQDKTRQHYQQLLAEVALLEKMQNDHEKQMVQAFEQKVESINKNMLSRNRLLQCENEIQNLEKEIQVMKSRVVPSNMKPLRPLRSFSSHQAENPQKLMPAKLVTKHKTFTHLLKHDQAGIPSSKGQRFTDRIILSKNNLTAKITGLKVYLDKQNGLIAGLQCTYSGNKKGGDNVRKDKDQRQKQYKEEEFNCRGSSFIRSVCGTLNAQDRLEYLAFTSSDGTSLRVGVAKSAHKNFNFEISPYEYPTCVFGSLVVLKEPGKREHSLVEHIGFEIQGDAMNSPPINEFEL